MAQSSRKARMSGVQPLPLSPAGSVVLADGIAFLENEDGTGCVFVWGAPTWSWDSSDIGLRRLCAVQIVNANVASQRQVANAFGVNETTVWRWRSEYSESGVIALLTDQHGPKGPSKLDGDKIAEIKALRSEGKTLLEIASQSGVSTDTVRRGISLKSLEAPITDTQQSEEELIPLAAPIDRSLERQSARIGVLDEAKPVITKGASLPLAGSLVILPALIATGLLDAAEKVYGSGRWVRKVKRASFYGLRSLVLCVVFSCLVRESRAEGLTRLDPVAIGRLLGLDRAPEVKRLRARMAELANEGKSDKFGLELALKHIESHPLAVGVFYVDGHVRAYHGKADVAKGHLARMRIAMPAEIDTWVSDRFGDGLLVWQSSPGASLVGELKEVTVKLRSLLGDNARPTICFDRGGWSPKLFQELSESNFDILTYRKGPSTLVEESEFKEYVFVDNDNKEHTYLLSDKEVTINYDRSKHSFSCRQITRLDKKTGHQTQVITTRKDEDPSLIAHTMFSRWRQENFFKYMRTHFSLDALDSYETLPDDPKRLVASPTYRDAKRDLDQVKALLQETERAAGRGLLTGTDIPETLNDTYNAQLEEVNDLKEALTKLPAKTEVAVVREQAERLDVERKRIMDAIRMATYNAESALARLLAPHYARSEDEARSLLREIFKTSADMEVIENELHIRIDNLSAPRRTKALAQLCEELSSTKTQYPGTNLKLVYSVKPSK